MVSCLEGYSGRRSFLPPQGPSSQEVRLTFTKVSLYVYTSSSISRGLYRLSSHSDALKRLPSLMEILCARPNLVFFGTVFHTHSLHGHCGCLVSSSPEALPFRSNGVKYTSRVSSIFLRNLYVYIRKFNVIVVYIGNLK